MFSFKPTRTQTDPIPFMNQGSSIQTTDPESSYNYNDEGPNIIGFRITLPKAPTPPPRRRTLPYSPPISPPKTPPNNTTTTIAIPSDWSNGTSTSTSTSTAKNMRFALFPKATITTTQLPVYPYLKIEVTGYRTLDKDPIEFHTDHSLICCKTLTLNYYPPDSSVWHQSKRDIFRDRDGYPVVALYNEELERLIMREEFSVADIVDNICYKGWKVVYEKEGCERMSGKKVPTGWRWMKVNPRESMPLLYVEDLKEGEVLDRWDKALRYTMRCFLKRYFMHILIGVLVVGVLLRL